MTKIYHRILQGVLAVLFCTHEMGAQALSGLYSINSTQATGGTNYQSFSDFATDINTNGVSGPVTVNVAPGTGPYVEQVLFSNVSGVSSTNKVTINGNANLLTFSSSNTGQRYTMGFNGTDYFVVNDLNMEGTGTYAYVCLLYSGADNNVFSGCSFSVPITVTSSNMIPVVISGSGTSYASSSNSGSNNMFVDCSTSGGWAGISMYGSSSAPQNTGNKIYNCTIGDFYQYGIRTYYHWGMHIKGNTIERLNRTSSSTTYGMYCYYSQGSTYEDNLIHKLFDAMNNPSNTTYCMRLYNYYSPSTPGRTPNICRNNIIADIRNNSTTYGLYVYYFDGEIYHNTLSLDHTGATSGTTYGIYAASQTGQPTNIHNNIVSITRGGSGTKYGIYFGNTSEISANYNNIYIGSTSGTNYHGYSGGQHSNLASWQSAGHDQNGSDLDPMFVSVNDVHPTNTQLNNTANPTGLVFDFNDMVRNQSTPDMGALEFMTPVCSGLPPSNTVAAPLYSICPGEDVTLSLGTFVSDAGFTYQWQVSNVSSVGPFTVIPGANSLFYTAPNVTQNTWYSVVMTCTAPGGASIAPVGQVMVSGPTVGSVPYYEGFETIGKPNRLPNCSWAASGLGDRNQTYTASAGNNRVARTGTGFAAFSNASTGSSYFWTHPIQMNTGITYSAALYYATEYFGHSNWTDLEILVGPNQSTTGLVQVAHVGPAISGPYKLLDNTFTVPTSGLYYVAIKATTGSGDALYLSWDDLSITIPCEEGSPNAPQLAVSASNNTVCAGDAVNFTATGADTYSWSTGSTGNTLVQNPMQTSTYTVYGTSQVSGCTATLSQLVIVNPAPEIIVIADKPVSCPGDQVSLTAFGADSYIWTTGSTGAITMVNPMTTTAYTVNGQNSYGCQTEYVHQVTVNPLPVIAILNGSPSDELCRNELVALTASGGQSYTWTGTNDPQIYQGGSITFAPQASDVYTVTGVDENGCKNIATIALTVNECTGLSKFDKLTGLQVMPNPTSGTVKISTGVTGSSELTLFDVNGRMVKTHHAEASELTMDLSDVAQGVYYLDVRANGEIKKIKVVKQ